MLKTLLFFIFLFTTNSFSQTVCKGTVSTLEPQAVANASVLIKDSDDHILQFGFTDKSGEYAIQIESEGTFIVEVNKIGFVKEQQPLEVTKNEKEYTVDFVLMASENVLEDMVIEIDNPIQLRGDTLVYDAKAFTIGHEQVVEDLLKNIPGITVEKDGKIKFEDKEIEKVMVDGDDLFNRGYSLLTKNMPNKPLDKVEILRRYSNNKLLKGVEDSDKVAINLTIQDEYKDLWFGDISMGYGLATANRYDVTGNLMNFSKKYKNFLSFGLNNVGIDRVGSLEDMFYNNYEVETVGRSSSLNGLMSMSPPRPGQLKDHRTRLNNAEHVSLSSIVPVNEKLKLKLTGFLGFDENYAFHERFSSVRVEDAFFDNYENDTYKSHIRRGYINLLATYDVSKTQMLQWSSVYSAGNVHSQNDLTFNDKRTLEQLETRNTFTDHKATFTHKWKDRNVVLIKSRFFSNQIPQFYQIDDYLMGGLFPYNIDALNNDMRNQKTFAGLEADFKLRQKNNDLIEFKVGYEYHQESMAARFSLFTDQGTILPQGFQTDSDFTLGDAYLRSGYTWKLKNVKLTGNADVHQLFNQFSTLESKKSQNPFYVNPSLSFNWELTPVQNISASYHLNFRNTSFVEVNDTYLLKSSRSFSKGLGEFRLTDNQMANVGYNIRHYLNRYRFSLNLNYSTQSRVLSSRSSIEQNSSLSEAIFIQGGENYGVNFSSNFYLRKIKSNIKFDTRYNQNISYNEVNNSGLRKNIFHSNIYNLEWRTSFRTPFNFHIGTEWTTSKVQSPDFTNSFTNGFSFLDLFYKVGERFDLKAVTEHYYFGNLDADQRNHLFLDFHATYKLKGEKWTVGISGNNLFNKQHFTTFYVSDIGYSSNTYRLMPRYLLLTAKYRFSL